MLRRIQKSIDFMVDTSGRAACVLLILLVAIISYNVIGRYAFNSSSIALEELSWHFYAAIFLLGISYALRSGSHVRVDLIYDSRAPKTKAWIDIIGTLVLLIPFSLLVFYYGFDFAWQSYSFGPRPDGVSSWIDQFMSNGIGEKSQDPGGLNNRFVIKAVIPLAFLLLFLSSLSFIIDRVFILRNVGNE